MALNASGQGFTYAGEATLTVGSVTGSSSKTLTTTSGIPPNIDSSMFPLVTATTLTDAGLAVGHSWISVSGTTATLNITIVNSSTTKTPANDPITFKVVIL